MGSQLRPFWSQRSQRKLKAGEIGVALASVRQAPGRIVKTWPSFGVGTAPEVGLSDGPPLKAGRGVVPGRAATPAVVGEDVSDTLPGRTRLRPVTVTA